MHDQMDEAGCASLKAREALLGMTWLCRSGALLASCAAIVLSCLCASATAQASTLPQGFNEQTVFSGLTEPTAIRFSPDGRVFVAEKSGLIKVFDSLSDPTPSVFADLRTKVHDFWDRGLLGIALDPGFPQKPYVYVALHLRRGDRRHSAAMGGAWPDHRRMPDAAWSDHRRVRRERAPVRLTHLVTRWSASRRCWSMTGANSSRATRSGRSNSDPAGRCTRRPAMVRASTTSITGRPATRPTRAGTRPPGPARR